MIKIEVITEAEAVAETTKGLAGYRLREAMADLGRMGVGQALKVESEDGKIAIERYRDAYKKAAVVMGIPLKIRISGGILYVRHKHGQEEPEDTAPDEVAEFNLKVDEAMERLSQETIRRNLSDEGQAAATMAPTLDSTVRADESLARTRAELDAAIGDGSEPDRCIWHPEAPGHGHDAEGQCLVPEKSE